MRHDVKIVVTKTSPKCGNRPSPFVGQSRRWHARPDAIGWEKGEKLASSGNGERCPLSMLVPAAQLHQL